MRLVKELIESSFRENKVFLSLSILSGGIRSLLMLMPTYFISLSLNNINFDQNRIELYIYVCMILFCQVVVMILYVLDTHINKYIFEISYKIKVSIFDSVFDTKKISERINKPEQIIVNGLNVSDQISDYYYSMISNLTWYIFTIIGAVVLMIGIDWKITLVIIILTLLQLFIVTQLKKFFKKINRQQKENDKEELFLLTQVIENNDYLKINNNEQNNILDNSNFLFSKDLILSIKLAFLETINENTNSIFNIAKQCVIFYYGYILFKSDRIELGDIVALNSYMLWIIPVLQGVHYLIKEREINEGNVDIISKYIEKTYKASENEKIKISQVEIFNKVVIPSKVLFIKGKSGVGKSTLAESFFKINKYYHNKIKLNDQKIENYNQDALINSIILCPQHPMMLDKTIKENIVLENTDISDEKVKHMLFKANLNLIDIDKRNPSNLSYGEKKRLMILRTLLIEREVYIFDEPTAGLDSENKLLILNLLSSYLIDKIVIIITHDDLEEIFFEYDLLFLK